MTKKSHIHSFVINQIAKTDVLVQVVRSIVVGVCGATKVGFIPFH
jgi:hypothetical protein